VRIALYGGSFNPPHVAHQLAALYVLETAPIDAVWLVPTFRHPFDKALLEFDHRLRMCELLAAPLGARVAVSDIERTLGGESRTLRTLRRLEADHPDHRFRLVIGSDLVPELASWYGVEQIEQAAPFLVVGRAGSTGAGQVAMPAVSSTAIRAALAAGASVEGLLPRAVAGYIYEHGLYGARDPR
jgi:nicotinate-nucleotide adenylyltransferase